MVHNAEGPNYETLSPKRKRQLSAEAKARYKGGEEDITNSAPIGLRSVESNTRNPDVQCVYSITAAQYKRVTITELDNDSSHTKDNGEGKFHE
ncbi:hypothetical protein B7463_g5010, partial [Scytalidium lignicola]